MTKKHILMVLICAASTWCWAEPPVASNYVVVGQPSIFWHNGQWQTYKNGVWTPYGQTATDSVAVRNRANGGAPALSPGSDDPAQLVVGSSPNQMTPARRQLLRERRAAAATNSMSGPTGPNLTTGRESLGTNQSNVSIGQPTMGIGQTTIGIGRPNMGIGQPSGIGQTTTDLQKKSPH